MTIRYALFLLLTLTLTGIIGYGTFATARLLRTWRPERNLLLLPQENAARVLLVFVCLGLGWLSGVDATALGWQWANWQADARLGLGVGLLLAAGFYTATRLLLGWGGGRFYSPSVLEILLPKDQREFWLVLLAFVPAVAVEELLFRSLLIGGLSPLLSPLVLLFVMGVAFGLLHSPQGVWGMGGAALAGVIFGLLFVETGSLVAPLLAHYVANSVQIGLAMQGNGRVR
ncbi:MAG: CPBP family intramembrane metalloprotease [Caldilineaceae bacterium]|nr:CPBP family intramembrane metalloprotease [Caldilineaceae bacterium]